ncbi:MAG: hypothetical protein HYX63_13370 [Gammaproteobacteria bacterium]|nr:hypothetical protein [Gammaproteobacteria bacterium]
MAIGTNDTIIKFGALTAITTGTPASISSAAFSAASDIAAWTNADDAPLARFILKCQWATATGVANKSVILHARAINIDSTFDAVVPSANRLDQIGVFNVYAAATATDYYFESTECTLPLLKTSQEFEFYLENQTGQAISSNWALKIMPFTFGPK